MKPISLSSLSLALLTYAHRYCSTVYGLSEKIGKYAEVQEHLMRVQQDEAGCDMQHLYYWKRKLGDYISWGGV